MVNDLEEQAGKALTGTNQFDIDGDGKTSPWEANICKMCLLAAIVIAFGDKALMFI